jgi:Zn-dependent protease
MGHVIAMRARGIAAEPPMFIPGLGAFIRQRSRPTDPVEDATIGLAGPIAGVAASIACWALFLAFDAPAVAALAKVGAWINLFNLLPLFSLDGGRAFRALSTIQRWAVAAACGALLYATSEGMLVLVLIGAALRIFAPADAPKRGHPRTLVVFLVLLALLAPRRRRTTGSHPPAAEHRQLLAGKRPLQSSARSKMRRAATYASHFQLPIAGLIPSVPP